MIDCNCNRCPRIKSKQQSKECKLGEKCDICDGNLVDLDEFTAIPQKYGISLTWITKSELDSQGFRVWRGTPDLGKYCGCSDNMDDYKQITMTTLDEKGNPTLIPATGSTTSGSNYTCLRINGYKRRWRRYWKRLTSRTSSRVVSDIEAGLVRMELLKNYQQDCTRDTMPVW